MKKNEQGYALLLTIMAVLLIMILGIGIITVSSNSLKTSTNERSTHSNFYLAESGLNYYETILIEEINNIFTEAKAKVKDNNLQSDIKFNAEFNNELKTLLTSINNKQVNSANFSSTLNGRPTVTVNVFYKDGTGLNPREFTLRSTAFTTAQTSTKKVERSYTIPNDVIKKNIKPIKPYEEVKENDTTTAPVIEEDLSYRDIKANFYIKDYLSILQYKSDLNAKYFVEFRNSLLNTTILTSNFSFLTSDLKNITTFNYNWNNVEYPSKGATYKTISYDIGSSLTSIPLDGKEIILDKNFKMGGLQNSGNHTFNLKFPNDSARSIVFENSWVNYNLNSLKFNVSGNGTLNIIFNKDFLIDAGHKFIINAPNANVNLIFKGNTIISGEMIAQDIYVLDNKSFKPFAFGKLIANNIYIEKGNFDKDLNASISVNDIYIKEGDLTVSGNEFLNRFAKPMNARNIAIEKGNVKVDFWGNLIASTIVLDNGNFNAFASSCVQANTISSPNNNTIFMNRADGIMNVLNYYAKSLYTTAQHQVNKTPCKKETFTIDPTLPGEAETKYSYDFKYDITKSPLIEIK